MAIIWTENLAVGVEIIDNEHKRLYEMVDQLFEACNAGKGKDFISEMIDFLEDYTKKHFKDEEEIMLKYAYPEYTFQKSQHESFIKKLDELKLKLDKDGSNLMVVLQANSMIIEWLNQHIFIQDKKIGTFIKENKLA